MPTPSFPEECIGCPYRPIAEQGGGFVPPDEAPKDLRLVVYGEAPGEEEHECRTEDVAGRDEDAVSHAPLTIAGAPVAEEIVPV